MGSCTFGLVAACFTITQFEDRFERLGNLMQTLQSPIKGKLEIGNIDFPTTEGKRQQKRFKSVCHTICISGHWKHHEHKLEQNGDAHLKVNCLLALYWQYIDSIFTVYWQYIDSILQYIDRSSDISWNGSNIRGSGGPLAFCNQWDFPFGQMLQGISKKWSMITFTLKKT